jgi:hypothetical protein
MVADMNVVEWQKWVFERKRPMLENEDATFLFGSCGLAKALLNEMIELL